MNLKQHAYQGHPVAFKVVIAEQDVTHLVADINEISVSLDYPQLNAYRPGDTEILLNDPDGDFSPDNASNFFVRANRPQSGFQVSIAIQTGYVVDGSEIMETLFTGKIKKLTLNGDAGTTTIVATDNFDTLFETPVDDFGIDRHFKLVLGEPDDAHGNYPIASFALPVSDASVTVKKSASANYRKVEKLSDTGVYDRENYVVDAGGVVSEYRSLPDPASGYPQFVGKTAFRDRDVRAVMDATLTKIGITDRQILIPEVVRDAHLSRDERIGYRVLGVASHGEPATEVLYYKGFPTDVVFDAGAFYILFNAPAVTSEQTRQDSMVLKYVQATDTWSVLYRRQTEMWGLAKSGNTLAFLCTDSELTTLDASDFIVPDQKTKPVDGSYDCTHPANKSYIVVFNEDSEAASVVVQKTDEFKAQIGYYFITGETQERLVDGTWAGRSADTSAAR